MSRYVNLVRISTADDEVPVILENTDTTRFQDNPNYREASDDEYHRYWLYYNGGPGDEDPPNELTRENIERWLG